jgi:Fanconi anemia group M protein
VAWIAPTRSHRIPGILLLEGDIYRDSGLSVASIAGVLSFVAMQDVVPVQTLSLPHTAYIVAKFVRHHVHGLGCDLGLRGSVPRKDPVERKAEFLLEGLPGVSNRLAKALLEHFGSVKSVVNATEKELISIDGIGTGKAAQIFAVLNQSCR